MHPTSGRRTGLARALVSLTAVLALVAAGVVVASGPAHAKPTVCDPGTRVVTFTTWSKSNVVTHASFVSVAKNTSKTITRSASFVRQLTASVAAGVEATVGANFAIGKLEGKVNFELRGVDAQTTTRSVSVSDHIEGPGNFFVWRGKKQVKGFATAKRCKPDGSGFTVRTGEVKSWNVNAEGINRCNRTYKSGSWKAKAEKIACP